MQFLVDSIRACARGHERISSHNRMKHRKRETVGWRRLPKIDEIVKLGPGCQLTKLRSLLHPDEHESDPVKKKQGRRKKRRTGNSGHVSGYKNYKGSPMTCRLG